MLPGDYNSWFLFLSSPLWLDDIGIVSSISTSAALPPSSHGKPGPSAGHIVDGKRGAEGDIVWRQRVHLVLPPSPFSVCNLLVWSQDWIVGVASTLRC